MHNNRDPLAMGANERNAIMSPKLQDYPSYYEETKEKSETAKVMEEMNQNQRMFVKEMAFLQAFILDKGYFVSGLTVACTEGKYNFTCNMEKRL